MNLTSSLPSEKLQSEKFETLQALRFLAALTVIILHSTFYTSERLSSGFPLYYEGYNGVRLFFVISGFVMIVSSEKLNHTAKGWKIFAMKRVIRIVPIYWIITSYKLLVLLLAPSLIYHVGLDLSFIIKSYFFIPAKNIDGELQPFLGVGWTLNFEMFFYFLFALALAFRKNSILFLCSIFVPLALVSIYKIDGWPDISFYANPIVLDFLYGMIAAKLILNGIRLPKSLSPIFIITGILYLFSPQLTHLLNIGSGYYTIITGMVAFMVVYCGASMEHIIHQKMSKWLTFLGSASYSLYLIHPIVAPLSPTILNRLHLDWPWFSVILSTSFSIIVGSVFYILCEKPLTNFLSKWTKKNI